MVSPASKANASLSARKGPQQVGTCQEISGEAQACMHGNPGWLLVGGGPGSPSLPWMLVPTSALM